MMHWVPAIVYIRFIKESGSHFSRLLAAILITMSLLSFLQLSYMLRCPLSLLFKVVVCFKDSRLFLWQIWSNLDNGARSNVGYYFVKLSFPLKKKKQDINPKKLLFLLLLFFYRVKCLLLSLSNIDPELLLEWTPWAWEAETLFEEQGCLALFSCRFCYYDGIIHLHPNVL